VTLLELGQVFFHAIIYLRH